MFKRIADTISPAANLAAAAPPPVRNGRPRRSRLGAFFPDITGFLTLIVLFAAGALYNPVPAIDAVT